MSTAKNVNQSIPFPTPNEVAIATKIEILYCLACEIMLKQLIYGVSLEIIRSHGKIVLFVSGISELSKKVMVTNLQTN